MEALLSAHASHLLRSTRRVRRDPIEEAEGPRRRLGEYVAVTIRPLLEADVDACAAIMLATPLLARYGITTEAAARGTLADVFTGPCRGLVAEEAGRIVGFAVYSVRGTFAHSGYVRTIAVAPDAQHRGVGRRLMDAVEAAIFDQGPNVFLLTSAWNAEAQRFYERRGYRRIGEIPDYVRSGITEVLYRKTLGPIQGTGS